MKLAGEQLVLDTNILLHLLRGKTAAALLEREYGISRRSPRAIISVVTKGELKALGYKFHWVRRNTNASTQCSRGCLPRIFHTTPYGTPMRR